MQPLIYPDPETFPIAESPVVLDQNKASPEEPGFLQRIWSAVSRAFSYLYDSVSNFFQSCFSTNKNVEPLSPPRNLPSLVDRQVDLRPSIKPSVEVAPVKTEKKANEAPQYVTFDDSLEELRRTARELVEVTIDVVYEKQVSPYIVTAQEAAPSLPPVVKSVTKLLIEMGDKAAKPLFQKLASQKAETIDPALKKILNILIRVDSVEFRTQLFNHLNSEISSEALSKGHKALDYLKPVIDWVCSPESERKPISTLLSDNQHLDAVLINQLCIKALDFYRSYQLTDIGQQYTSLEQKLTDELKESRIPIDQDLSRHYIRPILDWLLHSDQSEPIASLFVPKERYNDQLIDQTFELALTYIVEHNIDQYASRLDDLLQNQLQRIVYETIQTNSKNITDFLTQRIAELTTAIPFTETFDSIIQDAVSGQIEACIEAEKASDNSINPTEAYLRKFSQNKACHPFAKQIIQQRLILPSQGKDPEVARKSIEKAFFGILTEKLFNLMFPTRKILTDDGDIEEIDPFLDLWQRLSFPEELDILSKKIEEITQEFVTVDMRSLFSNVKQPTLEIARSVFKNTAQGIFKRQFSSLLQNAFEKLTLPSELDKLMAESIFPNINNQLLQVTVRQQFSQSIDLLIPHFHTWIKEGSENREMHIEAIQKVLIPLVKKRFHEFSENNFHITETKSAEGSSLTYDALSKEDWQLLTRYVIEDTERSLLKSLHKNPIFPASMPTETELLALYQTSSSTQQAIVPNPVYGEIAANLIFHLGEWPEYIGIGSFVKGLVSSSTTESVEEIRASHHYLVKIISDSIKSSFSDKEQMKEALYGAPSSPSVYTQEKLDHQIDILAKLAHDLITSNIEGQYTVVKFGVKKYIKEDSSAIKELISDVYKKVFGRHQINDNLLMQVCEKFFKGLHEADETIKQQQQLALHLNY